MTITLESTDRTTYINGVPARLWQGKTASGIDVHCFITRIAVREDEPRQEEFRRELIASAPPRVDLLATYFPDGVPLRLVL